ncbi:MAG: phosphatase PAP2 family protein [Spirosomataceae bacterium]
MQDQILFWNAVSLEANRQSHSGSGDVGVNGPTLSSRALAMVHLAMYDAYVGTSPGTALVSYLGLPSAAAGASTDVAIATAAHAVLSKLYPKQKPYFDAQHASLNISPAGYDEGFSFGMRVATTMWNLRQNDPGDSDDGFAPSFAKGRHRPDPNNPAPNNAPFYGAGSNCFAATRRWGIAPPPALASADYTRAVRQVRSKGIKPELMGTVSFASRRTSEETLIGIYWGYDGANGLGTPPRFFNQIIRHIAMNVPNPATGVVNNLEQNAHLFAMANAAMGDAGILAWEQKYKHNFWRPILGIREHDNSMGVVGVGGGNFNENLCDPCWLPLGAPKTNIKGENDFTPPFPAYPSGHATFGAAALHITRLFYGVPIGNFQPDNITNGLTFVSDEFNGVNHDSNGTTRPKHVRAFPDGLWQMIFENGLSRVFLGVHWYFDAFDLVPNALNPGGADGRDVAINEMDINVNAAVPTMVGIGGVPLGLAIAEDIFANGLIAANAINHP